MVDCRTWELMGCFEVDIETGGWLVVELEMCKTNNQLEVAHMTLCRLHYPKVIGFGFEADRDSGTRLARLGGFGHSPVVGIHFCLEMLRFL